MSDVKIGLGAGGRRGPRGERGERGERGHRGHQGATGPTGPAVNEGPPFFPPFPTDPTPVVTTIFANASGSDVTGDGSAANPFQTFARAILNVPDTINPGNKFVVDITGLGTELLPDNYQLPEIISPLPIATADDPTTFPFRFTAPLTIMAQPQLATNIPIGDTQVPAIDIVSVVAGPAGLAILTVNVPRPSWAGDALKGKQFIGNNSGHASSAIFGSNTTQIFLANQPSQVPQTGSYTIVEPSATLETNNPGISGAAVTVFGSNAIAFNGIHFVCLSPGNSGLAIIGVPQPICDLCVIEGLEVNACVEQVILNANVISNGFNDLETSSITSFTSLWLNAAGYLFSDNSEFVTRRTVFDGNPQALGPSSAGAAVTIGAIATPSWDFGHTIIKSTADNAIHAIGPSLWCLQHVVIQGSTGDAILAELAASMVLEDVTGGTGGAGDPANGGFGLNVQNGSVIQVTDDATLVTGTSRDMKVGALAVRTWTDFRTVAPTFNQLDNTFPPVGGVGGGTSLSRVFEAAPGTFPP